MYAESMPKRITAIVACYRDAPAVPFMYERLKAVCAKIGVDYEIIFVNDGSPDNADEVLVELAARDSKVVVIRHSRNFGSQNAFTSGMRIATGDAVVLLDGDLQDPPELIEDFYQCWLAKDSTSYTAFGCSANPRVSCRFFIRRSIAYFGRHLTSRCHSMRVTFR